MLEKFKYFIIPKLVKRLYKLKLSLYSRSIIIKEQIMYFFLILFLGYIFLSWMDDVVNREWLFTRTGFGTPWYDGMLTYRDLNPFFDSKVVDTYSNLKPWFFAIILIFLGVMLSPRAYYFLKRFHILVVSLGISAIDNELPHGTWHALVIWTESGGLWLSLLVLGCGSWWMNEACIADDTEEFYVYKISLETQVYNYLYKAYKETDKEQSAECEVIYRKTRISTKKYPFIFTLFLPMKIYLDKDEEDEAEVARMIRIKEARKKISEPRIYVPKVTGPWEEILTEREEVRLYHKKVARLSWWMSQKRLRSVYFFLTRVRYFEKFEVIDRVCSLFYQAWNFSKMDRFQKVPERLRQLIKKLKNPRDEF